MSPLSHFKSLEAYDRYTVIVQRIENEKTVLSQNLIYKEEYVVRLNDYQGDYTGMSVIVDGLRKVNASITINKKELQHLTKKYYELLKYFTVFPCAT